MARTVSRKRPRTIRKTQRQSLSHVSGRYLVDANGKRIAIVLDLAEYRRLIAGARNPSRMSAARRAELVTRARRAEGSWKESEGTGTAVEIVRRLRDEWERK